MDQKKVFRVLLEWWLVYLMPAGSSVVINRADSLAGRSEVPPIYANKAASLC